MEKVAKLKMRHCDVLETYTIFYNKHISTNPYQIVREWRDWGSDDLSVHSETIERYADIQSCMWFLWQISTGKKYDAVNETFIN